MRDKIVPHVEEILNRTQSKGDGWVVLPMRDEIFHVMHRIYPTNSLKGITTNLRHCLRDFLSRENREDVLLETGRGSKKSHRPGNPVSKSQ